jgi:phosphoribosylaminoimidazolecarboxamide formyltransferase/IMP cyclohydrolase
VSDGIIAPGYEDGAIAILAPKKHGTFLLLTANPDVQPPDWERRDVYGVELEQQRDRVVLTPDLLTVATGPALPPHAVRDALLGLAAVRYTQSNSVAMISDGAALGIGAGQQNRVDCVRLAGAKTATWWLRRHEHIQNLPAVPGMLRQDRLNWQIRMAEQDMTPRQLTEFAALFPGTRPYLDEAARNRWLARLDSVTLCSDGFLPFRDNVDHASRAGVRYVIEPGGSSRSDEVAAACEEYGMSLVTTGLRLFHH